MIEEENSSKLEWKRDIEKKMSDFVGIFSALYTIDSVVSSKSLSSQERYERIKRLNTEILNILPQEVGGVFIESILVLREAYRTKECNDTLEVWNRDQVTDYQRSLQKDSLEYIHSLLTD